MEIFLALFPMAYVYLRNKETQQTLRVIVILQYEASFLCNDIIHESSMCPSNYSRFNVIIDYVMILICP